MEERTSKATGKRTEDMKVWSAGILETIETKWQDKEI